MKLIQIRIILQQYYGFVNDCVTQSQINLYPPCLLFAGTGVTLFFIFLEVIFQLLLYCQIHWLWYEKYIETQNKDLFRRSCQDGNFGLLQALLKLPYLNIPKGLKWAFKHNQYQIIEILFSDIRLGPIPQKYMFHPTIPYLTLRRFRQQARIQKRNLRIRFWYLKCLAELSSLPPGHLHENFPGGTDYHQIKATF